MLYSVHHRYACFEDTGGVRHRRDSQIRTYSRCAGNRIGPASSPVLTPSSRILPPLSVTLPQVRTSPSAPFPAVTWVILHPSGATTSTSKARGSPSVSSEIFGEIQMLHKPSSSRRTVNVGIIPSPSIPTLAPQSRTRTVKSRDMPRFPALHINFFMLHSMRPFPAA